MKHAEDNHQAALVRWAFLAHIPGRQERVAAFLFAVPNGGRRNAREAGRLKVCGVKAGVSDLMLAYPAHGLAGLFLEMKAPDGDKPTTAQRDWLERMTAVGYGAACCYGVDEAIKTITAYLGGTFRA